MITMSQTTRTSLVFDDVKLKEYCLDSKLEKLKEYCMHDAWVQGIWLRIQNNWQLCETRVWVRGRGLRGVGPRTDFLQCFPFPIILHDVSGLSPPIRGHYHGHVITLSQSEAGLVPDPWVWVYLPSVSPQAVPWCSINLIKRHNPCLPASQKVSAGFLTRLILCRVQDTFKIYKTIHNIL